METIRHVTVDLYKAEIVPVVKCKQYDTGRQIGVRLTDNGQIFDITGAETRIFAKKPDGTLVYNNAVTVSNNEAVFNITSQMSAVTGKLMVEIRAVKDDRVVSSPIAMLDVLPSNINDGAIESTNEFVVLEEFVKWAQENIPKIEQTEAGREAAEAIRNTAEDARKMAETARKNAESEREAAEDGRQTAETKRETAEAQRETDTDTAIREVNKTADDLVLWFESIQKIIDTGGIDGKQLAELNDMIIRLYAVAGIADIDNIIASTYIDTDDTTAVFNTATNEDIDNMISGDYVDTGDDGGIFDDVSITDQEIEQLINSLFKEAA